ncbi:MAG: WYL domain-containing protein [Actinobacteria bacterium]|uniref:Unannotated protein n=1 Tax=freshwater metagenome TaxID=449393 RepID=A0A6J7J4N4_9ZZZZ|nr:WYL domain-containing protein [Actinomycetota bacterium]
MTGGATRRSERLLTLVFVLLNSSRGVSRARLRSTIPDYVASDSDQAFERMFERDKDALRELGIPVDTVQLESGYDDEWGYRIDPRAYELPDLTFTTDEMVALELAARAWSAAALEGPASAALRKLESVGLEVPDDARGVPVEPRLSASDPAFPDLLRAIVDKRSVEFSYRKLGSTPETRHVEPWGLVLRLGHTYLVGLDTDRGATRAFRVSRIEGAVKAGRPDAVTVPEGTDLRTLVGDGEPEDASGVARLRVVPQRAMRLRQRAGATPDAAEIDLPFRSLDRLERELAAYGPDVLVLDPPELRAAVIRRLQGVLSR